MPLPLTIYHRHRDIIKFSLFLIGLIFVLLLVKESWNEILALFGRIKITEYVIAIIIGVFCNTVLALLFNRLLNKHGVALSDRFTLKIYMIGQIAKYIPGKVWGIAYQISHVKNISSATGVVLANLELMLVTMLMTSVVAVTILSSIIYIPLAVIISLLGIGAFLSLYTTEVVHIITSKFIIKYENRLKLEKIKYTPTNLFSGMIFFILFCITYIFSYAYMLNAAFDYSLQDSLIYIALLSLAWLAGVLVFIVPNGMGVRELVFLITSGYVIQDHSVEILLSIAILSRITQIIQELAGALLALLLQE